MGIEPIKYVCTSTYAFIALPQMINIKLMCWRITCLVCNWAKIQMKHVLGSSSHESTKLNRRARNESCLKKENVYVAIATN